jgi:superoxide dismutase, Fe-Mn family
MMRERSGQYRRREFLRDIALAGAAVSVYSAAFNMPVASGQTSSGVSLPPLPYPQNALAPVISENTISFHYGKHHQAYVNNTIKMIAGTDMAGAGLVEIIKKASASPEKNALFNNAAQVFNHNFYWNSMKPGGGGEPKGKMADKIAESFGGYQKFAEAFSSAAASQFGSGWAWLVETQGKLQVLKTSNADTPIVTGSKPLITIDVWEHAYYLDYQNRRADYIKGFLEKLLNWDFAEKNLTDQL